MLTTNTMRYGTDEFAFNKSGLIYSNTLLDCTKMTQVDGLDAIGLQPAGSDRRVAFKVDGIWYKLNGTTATLAALTTQALTVDSVLAEGNTVAELQTITSIAGFVGKLVAPAIALIAPPDATEYPTLKITIKGKSNQDLYTKEYLSPEFEVNNTAIRVFNFNSDTFIDKGGTVTVLISLKDSLGVWSDWLTITQANDNKSATAVKFKTICSSTTLGVSVAKVNSILFSYSNQISALAGGDKADIITVSKEFGDNVLQARLLVKHQPLIDATINANVCIKAQPKSVTDEILGVGDGSYKTFYFKNKDGLVPSSIKLYFNTTRIYVFDYNTSTGAISCIAPIGVSITTDYDYGMGSEEWVLLSKGTTYKGISEDTTEFFATLPISDKAVNSFSVSLNKTTGNIEGEVLGIGSGVSQSVVLKHIGISGKISIYADESFLPKENFVYDQRSKILTVTAPAGSMLKANYQWVSEQPIVNSVTAMCSE